MHSRAIRDAERRLRPRDEQQVLRGQAAIDQLGLASSSAIAWVPHLQGRRVAELAARRCRSRRRLQPADVRVQRASTVRAAASPCKIK